MNRSCEKKENDILHLLRIFFYYSVVDDFKIVKNLPNITHWNLDDGYEFDKKTNEYPFRTSSFGNGENMIKFSTSAKDLMNECKRVDGFRISLDIPGQVPFEFSRTIPTSKYSRIKIKAKLDVTSKLAKDYEPRDRPCYFMS